MGTPKSVKKLRNDTILVECFTRQQSENLLKHKKFYHLHVKIYPHNTLNICKGVVRCKELSLCSIAEIHDGLKSQGVTDVKRISVRRNGETRTTNTYILTFSSPDLPRSVKIGYISAKVDLYIPNPMRCFKCQQAAEKAPSRPKTRVQLATDLPSASTFKDQTNLSEKEEIFETRVSDSEVSQLIDTEKSTRG